MRILPAIAALMLLPQPALAGAWTQPQGHWQIITSLWASNADAGFDGSGGDTVPIRFRKALFQTASEYGWTDHLTLLLNTESAYADVRRPGTARQHALDNAVEGGARYRLSDSFGILSVQASFKSAGAFNFAISANSGQAGRAGELRLLYGTNFALLGDRGFLDVEAAERFMSAPRPDETPIDVTAGVWLTPDWLAMVQSFNLISSGGGAPPYAHYRSHKLEISAVRRLSSHFLAQAGVFYSPLGQNALVEQGLCLSLWTRL